jgi:hypothetical protein
MEYTAVIVIIKLLTAKNDSTSDFVTTLPVDANSPKNDLISPLNI